MVAAGIGLDILRSALGDNAIIALSSARPVRCLAHSPVHLVRLGSRSWSTSGCTAGISLKSRKGKFWRVPAVRRIILTTIWGDKFPSAILVDKDSGKNQGYKCIVDRDQARTEQYLRQHRQCLQITAGRSIKRTGK